MKINISAGNNIWMKLSLLHTISIAIVMMVEDMRKFLETSKPPKLVVEISVNISMKINFRKFSKIAILYTLKINMAFDWKMFYGRCF
jgi:hypothetical protein